MSYDKFSNVNTTISSTFSNYWSGLTTSSHNSFFDIPKNNVLTNSYIIKAKCNILKKLNLNIRTKTTIYQLCTTFLKDYDLYQWKCDNIDELVVIVKELVNSDNEDDLIIAIEILKNLERK